MASSYDACVMHHLSAVMAMAGQPHHKANNTRGIMGLKLFKCCTPRAEYQREKKHRRLQMFRHGMKLKYFAYSTAEPRNRDPIPTHPLAG
ncbi:hypothetical protein EYR41_010406 [Orbilia oligospora]|uniref:Uncharacterized protein n=1 Tax=Orbilia oligospora TaxID=2813651 RepID=A0A8H2DPJ8_ORBOL|nr:hypothetical protein EYR41_010406 [Orbilia oligospora]